MDASGVYGDVVLNAWQTPISVASIGSRITTVHDVARPASVKAPPPASGPVNERAPGRQPLHVVVSTPHICSNPLDYVHLIARYYQHQRGTLLHHATPPSRLPTLLCPPSYGAHGRHQASSHTAQLARRGVTSDEQHLEIVNDTVSTSPGEHVRTSRVPVSADDRRPSPSISHTYHRVVESNASPSHGMAHPQASRPAMVASRRRGETPLIAMASETPLSRECPTPLSASSRFSVGRSNSRSGESHQAWFQWQVNTPSVGGRLLSPTTPSRNRDERTSSALTQQQSRGIHNRQLELEPLSYATPSPVFASTSREQANPGWSPAPWVASASMGARTSTSPMSMPRPTVNVLPTMQSHWRSSLVLERSSAWKAMAVTGSSSSERINSDSETGSGGEPTPHIVCKFPGRHARTSTALPSSLFDQSDTYRQEGDVSSGASGMRALSTRSASLDSPSLSNNCEGIVTGAQMLRSSVDGPIARAKIDVGSHWRVDTGESLLYVSPYTEIPSALVTEERRSSLSGGEHSAHCIRPEEQRPIAVMAAARLHLSLSETTTSPLQSPRGWTAFPRRSLPVTGSREATATNAVDTLLPTCHPVSSIVAIDGPRSVRSQEPSQASTHTAKSTATACTQSDKRELHEFGQAANTSSVMTPRTSQHRSWDLPGRLSAAGVSLIGGISPSLCYCMAMLGSAAPGRLSWAPAKSKRYSDGGSATRLGSQSSSMVRLSGWQSFHGRLSLPAAPLCFSDDEEGGLTGGISALSRQPHSSSSSSILSSSPKRSQERGRQGSFGAILSGASLIMARRRSSGLMGLWQQSLHSSVAHFPRLSEHVSHETSMPIDDLPTQLSTTDGARGGTAAGMGGDANTQCGVCSAEGVPLGTERGPETAGDCPTECQMATPSKEIRRSFPADSSLQQPRRKHIAFALTEDVARSPAVGIRQGPQQRPPVSLELCDTFSMGLDDAEMTVEDSRSNLCSSRGRPSVGPGCYDDLPSICFLSPRSRSPQSTSDRSFGEPPQTYPPCDLQACSVENVGTDHLWEDTSGAAMPSDLGSWNASAGFTGAALTPSGREARGSSYAQSATNGGGRSPSPHCSPVLCRGRALRGATQKRMGKTVVSLLDSVERVSVGLGGVGPQGGTNNGQDTLNYGY